MHTTGQSGIVFITASRMEDGFRLCSHSTLQSLQVNPFTRSFKVGYTRRERAKCKELGSHSAHRVLEAFKVATHQSRLQRRNEIDEPNGAVDFPGK